MITYVGIRLGAVHDGTEAGRGRERPVFTAYACTLYLLCSSQVPSLPVNADLAAGIASRPKHASRAYPLYRVSRTKYKVRYGC